MGDILTGAERAEDVAGLETGRGARRARGERGVLHIHKERLALDVRKAQVDAARVGRFGRGGRQAEEARESEEGGQGRKSEDKGGEESEEGEGEEGRGGDPSLVGGERCRYGRR